jgi:hypothetical protein
MCDDERVATRKNTQRLRLADWKRCICISMISKFHCLIKVEFLVVAEEIMHERCRLGPIDVENISFGVQIFVSPAEQSLSGSLALNPFLECFIFQPHSLHSTPYMASSLCLGQRYPGLISALIATCHDRGHESQWEVKGSVL